MRKSINPQAIDVQHRFFEALQYGITNCIIKGGMRGFCIAHNLNRSKYVIIKNNLSIDSSQVSNTYKVIDIDALIYICNDLNVSPEWLLLGKGKMFRK